MNPTVPSHTDSSLDQRPHRYSPGDRVHLTNAQGDTVGGGYYHGLAGRRDRVLVENASGELLDLAVDEIRPARPAPSVGGLAAQNAAYAAVIGAIHNWTHLAADAPPDDRLAACADVINDFLATAAGRRLLVDQRPARRADDIVVTEILPAAGGGAR